MQCPLCPDATLEPKYVGPTEVDICPRCRGIWLDRGELDRLLGHAPRDAGRSDRSDRRFDDDRSRARLGGDRFDDRFDDDRFDDDRFDDDRFDDDRFDDDRRSVDRNGRPVKKSKARRLADLFEDVLDF